MGAGLEARRRNGRPVTMWRLDWREIHHRPNGRHIAGNTGGEWHDDETTANRRASVLAGKGWDVYVYPVEVRDAG